MVGERADHEDGQRDVAQRHGLAAHGVAATAQVVVQEQAAQVLRVHPGRHARGVGVPGHEVVHGRALAEQVFVDHARPQQIVGAQHLERAGHLPGLEIAGLVHLRLEQAELALVDEQRQLAGLGEVGLGREQRHGGQALVAIARHGGRGDGEQGAAQAVAGRMHLAFGHDGAHGIERGVKSMLQIVVHAQVAVLHARVLPRDAEHRMAVIDEVADQRVVRRQVQDVVLHDPGRHDQDGLGVHGLGRGRILDQLH